MMLKYRKMSVVVAAAMAILLIAELDSCVQAEKEIPMTKLGQKVGDPTLTVLYCYSCGYKKAFEDYTNILHERYPPVSIRGATYDPPGCSIYFSKAVFIMKFLLIAIIVPSYNIFGAFGLQPPRWWRFFRANKLYTCMMIFFVGNLLEAHLSSSGAFEISLNDIPVWSKLQTGRLPRPQELFEIIDSLLFGDKFN